MTNIFAQDPGSKLDYTWDFTDMLGDGVTLGTPTFSSNPSGLVIENDSETEGVVTVYISGGADGALYQAS